VLSFGRAWSDLRNLASLIKMLAIENVSIRSSKILPLQENNY
jgi:hypothetical protein